MKKITRKSFLQRLTKNKEYLSRFRDAEEDGDFIIMGCNFDPAEGWDDIFVALCFGVYASEGNEISLLLEMLECIESETQSWEYMVSDVFKGMEHAAYLICAHLAKNRIIESGVSIRRAWLTDKGKYILSELRRYIEDSE